MKIASKHDASPELWIIFKPYLLAFLSICDPLSAKTGLSIYFFPVLVFKMGKISR